MKTYTVRRGDSLSAIAKAFKITLKELLTQNPQISNPNLIRSGEQILIPDVGPKPSLHAVIAELNNPSSDPAWLKIALREAGVTEVGGSGNNPRILEYHATTSLKKADALQDKTAWCSSFVNWCMEQSGRKGTDSAWALDWRSWGAALAEPRRGCVVVFSRKGLTTNGGHVGFYVGDSKKSIEVFGGNQGNSVNASKFPKDGIQSGFHYKHVAYRWPT
jgi:uncharacterized protein (TIGR02594 family)